MTPAQDDFTAAAKRRKGTSRAVEPVSLATRLRKVSLVIANSEWARECQRKIESCLANLGWQKPEILCLGLGSPTESVNAVAQLTLVISIFLVTSFCPQARESVSFYDPHFTKEDADSLRELAFTVLSENKVGKHVLRRTTLLVMPHCALGLYENVLRENWSIEGLGRLLLLGNVLEDYATATPAAKLALETPCVSRIWKHLFCEPISTFDEFPHAFNNLGLQYVRATSLPQPEDEMWNLPLPNVEQSRSAEIVQP